MAPEKDEVHEDIRKASTLPGRFYTDPQTFAAARDTIFARSWQLAGDADRVKVPGKVAPVVLLEGCLDEPLLLTRDGADRIHCLSNVCTHRGNLVRESEGVEQVLRCRYHGRRFGLDGRFLSMPEFEGVEGFPSDADSLPRPSLARWGKSLFVSLALAFAFDALVAEMDKRLTGLPLQDAVLDPAGVRDYAVRAHWMSDAPRLSPKLGTWDATLITIGSIVGSGIFTTTGSMAAVLPHPGLLLLVWVGAGALVFTGCQTYAELGTLFPRAGGVYHFLKESYGPFPAFLFGWSAFLVIMSGGIAAIAAGFGEYLGTFAPFFSSGNRFFTVPIGSTSWSPNGAQAAGLLAILALTVVSHFGVRQGAALQDVLTVLKLGAIAAFIAVGLLVPAPAPPAPFPPLPPGNLAAALGVAMIGALWTYDGWYGLTFSAGELKDPSRSLPRGMIAGVLAVVGVYTLTNYVYLRALPVEILAQSPRVGESAARALFGLAGERLISGAIVLSTFGCLSATILYSSRIYFPMAQDGLFFRSLAAVHPEYRTPSRSLCAQSAWSMLLVLSGSYEQLYTYVTFFYWRRSSARVTSGPVA